MAALSGCSPPAERVEAGEVRRAIDRLRSADPADVARMRELVGEVEKKKATLPEAKQARDACAEAYRLFVEEREIMGRARPKVKARAGLSDGELAVAEADLDLAQAKLDAANAAMPKCDAASTALSVALSH